MDTNMGSAYNYSYSGDMSQFAGQKEADMSQGIICSSDEELGESSGFSDNESSEINREGTFEEIREQQDEEIRTWLEENPLPEDIDDLKNHMDRLKDDMALLMEDIPQDLGEKLKSELEDNVAEKAGGMKEEAEEKLRTQTAARQEEKKSQELDKGKDIQERRETGQRTDGKQETSAERSGHSGKEPKTDRDSGKSELQQKTCPASGKDTGQKQSASETRNTGPGSQLIDEGEPEPLRSAPGREDLKAQHELPEEAQSPAKESTNEADPRAESARKAAGGQQEQEAQETGMDLLWADTPAEETAEKEADELRKSASREESATADRTAGSKSEEPRQTDEKRPQKDPKTMEQSKKEPSSEKDITGELIFKQGVIARKALKPERQPEKKDAGERKNARSQSGRPSSGNETQKKRPAGFMDTMAGERVARSTHVLPQIVRAQKGSDDRKAGSETARTDEDSHPEWRGAERGSEEKTAHKALRATSEKPAPKADTAVHQNTAHRKEASEHQKATQGTGNHPEQNTARRAETPVEQRAAPRTGTPPEQNMAQRAGMSSGQSRKGLQTDRKLIGPESTETWKGQFTGEIDNRAQRKDIMAGRPPAERRLSEKHIPLQEHEALFHSEADIGGEAAEYREKVAESADRSGALQRQASRGVEGNIRAGRDGTASEQMAENGGTAENRGEAFESGSRGPARQPDSGEMIALWSRIMMTDEGKKLVQRLISDGADDRDDDEMLELVAGDETQSQGRTGRRTSERSDSPDRPGEQWDDLDNGSHGDDDLSFHEKALDDTMQTFQAPDGETGFEPLPPALASPSPPAQDSDENTDGPDAVPLSVRQSGSPFPGESLDEEYQVLQRDAIDESATGMEPDEKDSPSSPGSAFNKGPESADAESLTPAEPASPISEEEFSDMPQIRSSDADRETAENPSAMEHSVTGLSGSTGAQDADEPGAGFTGTEIQSQIDLNRFPEKVSSALTQTVCSEEDWQTDMPADLMEPERERGGSTPGTPEFAMDGTEGLEAARPQSPPELPVPDFDRQLKEEEESGTGVGAVSGDETGKSRESEAQKCRTGEDTPESNGVFCGSKLSEKSGREGEEHGGNIWTDHLYFLFHGTSPPSAEALRQTFPYETVMRDILRTLLRWAGTGAGPYTLPGCLRGASGNALSYRQIVRDRKSLLESEYAGLLCAGLLMTLSQNPDRAERISYAQASAPDRNQDASALSAYLESLLDEMLQEGEVASKEKSLSRTAPSRSPELITPKAGDDGDSGSSQTNLQPQGEVVQEERKAAAGNKSGEASFSRLWIAAMMTDEGQKFMKLLYAETAYDPILAENMLVAWTRAVMTAEGQKALKALFRQSTEDPALAADLTSTWALASGTDQGRKSLIHLYSHCAHNPHLSRYIIATWGQALLTDEGKKVLKALFRQSSQNPELAQGTMALFQQSMSSPAGTAALKLLLKEAAQSPGLSLDYVRMKRTLLATEGGRKILTDFQAGVAGDPETAGYLTALLHSAMRTEEGAEGQRECLIGIMSSRNLLLEEMKIRCAALKAEKGSEQLMRYYQHVVLTIS
ncbi:MAG: hypothetical protein AB2L14_01740 [Candidatus Xenobiia bacterium LiM19]